jgi:16S rRNA A1518/A1519 N6-dimethyltransferase RsmA/KsgA/DIM1 with predicted DNA glycosylase/AP lyase activity
VHSALVALVPRRPPALPPAEIERFSEFLLALFSLRRKVLTTALRAARPRLDADGAAATCERVGVDPRVRPEAVSPDALLALFRAT